MESQISEARKWRRMGYTVFN